MKTTTLLVVGLTLGAPPAFAERPLLRGGEAPRATDLLRAEKLPEQAEKRLRLPPARRGGWKKGGGGWDAPGEAPTPAPSDRVIIDLGRPRRRAPMP